MGPLETDPTAVRSITGITDVFKDPHRAARRILEQHRIFGLTALQVAGASSSMVVLKLTLRPWTPMAEDQYPVEQATLVLLSDGRIFALPDDARRQWRHRMPAGLRELCLWYVDDRADLQWSWTNGLEALITIVHRHLMAEEYNRRHHRWPFEEAPHGPGPHHETASELRATAASSAPSPST